MQSETKKTGSVDVTCTFFEKGVSHCPLPTNTETPPSAANHVLNSHKGMVYLQPYPGYIHGKQPRINGLVMPTSVELLSESAKATLTLEASYFLDLCHREWNTSPEEHQARKEEVLHSIQETGSYEHTTKELQHGLRVAWRNAPKCPGRASWENIDLFDCRKVTTNKEMAESLFSHLRQATPPEGGITPFCSMFRSQMPGTEDGPRVWNNQLIRYCGHHQENGKTIGDLAEADFTTFVKQHFGWKGPQKQGSFDVLPLVLQIDPSKPPELFEIPPDCIKEVEIEHPSYPWFGSKIGLKWCEEGSSGGTG
ncbi:hypothetical protein CYMTET_32672 [Cymbomonas tetramitiformis]|uniref:nitric-oxide synthase (NADPH) n=1 Tax=Cymbomonas tetramitiformis TaxID=36881 RepID=A0AAE0FFA8_9CHLO|nr:hypothetical protein CYMTET_32672 [Cymbomonas tetramitiformis]